MPKSISIPYPILRELALKRTTVLLSTDTEMATNIHTKAQEEKLTETFTLEVNAKLERRERLRAEFLALKADEEQEVKAEKLGQV